jgi:hypothetical protein
VVPQKKHTAESASQARRWGRFRTIQGNIEA